MLRTLLSCLLLLAFAADASAQTTPAAPATVQHTTQQKTTTRRTTSKPRRTTVRKTSTKKVGMAAPASRSGAVVRSQPTAATAPDPASGKGQGVYAAPGEPVNIDNGATTGYDGAASRRKTKTTTTLTPR